MAIYEKKNARTNTVAKSGGGKVAKAGTGYTATSTNKSTGKKTTKSGTLTPTTRSDFVSGAVSGAVTNGAGKMMRTKTPLKKRTYSGTNTSRAPSNTKKKLY